MCHKIKPSQTNQFPSFFFLFHVSFNKHFITIISTLQICLTPSEVLILNLSLSLSLSLSLTHSLSHTHTHTHHSSYNTYFHIIVQCEETGIEKFLCGSPSWQKKNASFVTKEREFIIHFVPEAFSPGSICLRLRQNWVKAEFIALRLRRL